ncbi:Zinc-type alcohol dehydrogenase-like protein-like protein [Paramyrothecium foliicola]|nr:Zinc-type alcohol dehydrogenase-like protein-like protein [Paramyrothecium foliicola]
MSSYWIKIPNQRQQRPLPVRGKRNLAPVVDRQPADSAMQRRGFRSDEAGKLPTTMTILPSHSAFGSLCSDADATMHVGAGSDHPSQGTLWGPYGRGTAPAAPLEVVDDLPRQSPGPKQALVKSLFVAINPVDPWMAYTGAMTAGMPTVLGSDASGVVVEAGEGCTKLQKGDYIYGSSRLGVSEYQPFQDTYLVDEDLVHKLGPGKSIEGASTIAVGVFTAVLGIIAPWNAALPEPGSPPAQTDEWVIILGGSGTVGHFAVQIARLCGFRIAASCSASKSESVLQLGATATFDNRATPEEQAEEIRSITGGRFAKIFDASGKGHQVAVEAFKHSTESSKYLSTSIDSTEVKIPEDIDEFSIQLGLIGRDTVEGEQVNRILRHAVPFVEAYVNDGLVTPVEYDLFEKTGWEGLKDAMGFYSSGKATKKIVVKVQDE